MTKLIITCEIRDEFGDVQSAGFVDTTAQAVSWFALRDIDFQNVEGRNDGENVVFTYVEEN